MQALRVSPSSPTSIDSLTFRYVPKQSEPADVEKKAELKKELLRSKIDLGQDPNYWDTTYRCEHDEKPYCKDSGKSKQIMQDLRSSHYHLGYRDRPLDTTYGDEFIDRKGRPSNLDPNLAKDLRSHHGNFGIDPQDWTTTYRGAHFWKQPDPEEVNN